MVIYHAGTGKTTFLACLKLTTIFTFAFFGLVATPAYISADEPIKAGGSKCPGQLMLKKISLVVFSARNPEEYQHPPFFPPP